MPADRTPTRNVAPMAWIELGNGIVIHVPLASVQLVATAGGCAAIE